MCTVSWLHTHDGYQLLCNRDERHTRKPALAPFVQELQGVRFIAPVDGDHGGSWIAVNEFGLTVCLLNRYDFTRPPREIKFRLPSSVSSVRRGPGGGRKSQGTNPLESPLTKGDTYEAAAKSILLCRQGDTYQAALKSISSQLQGNGVRGIGSVAHNFGTKKDEYQSRGLLLMELADCSSLAKARSRISRFELDQFPPFSLVVLEPREPCLLFHWTGYEGLLERNGEYAMPLASSSFDYTGVQVCRQQILGKLAAERGQVDIQALLDFHASHLPARNAYSPCMHRADAATVSFSWITVTGNRIRFSYLPCAPCSHEKVDEKVLNVRAAVRNGA